MPLDVIGRDDEIALATAVITDAEAGPAALLVEGEAGIGKTVVWRAVLRKAADHGLRVLRARPAESESSLAFGALADLLRDLDDPTLAALPGPQRHALEVALLRAEPDATDGDPRSVLTATASVLRALAERGPVLVAVDDAQWLDSASAAALAFAVRRLDRARVRYLVCVRTPGPRSVIGLESALPEGRIRRLRLGPLEVCDLHAMFETHLGRSFPKATLERIADASSGNAFHALEIGRALAAEPDPLPGAPLPVPAAVRDLAAERLRGLPPATRAALLRVAALSRPTTGLVPAASLAPAEAAGIVEILLDGRIRFAHPLFAAAVYGDAATNERRETHRALAGLVPDIEERARHEALAATGPDSDVAALLTDAAARARARGATAHAAELAELALWLTPAHAAGDRFRRAMRHAEYLCLAGQNAHARAVLETAIRNALPGDDRDEALIALSLVCRESDIPTAIRAAEDALASATSPAIVARAHATLGLHYESIDVSKATRHSLAAAELFRELGDEAASGDAMLGHRWHELLLGHGTDEGAFWQAFEASRGGPPAVARWLGLPPVWVLAHDDYGRARQLFVASLDQARKAGSEAEVGLLLAVVAQIDGWRGDPEAADATIDQAVEVARLGGSPASLADALRIRSNIDAVRGRAERALETLGPEMAALGVTHAGRLTYGAGVVRGAIALGAGDAATADVEFTRTTAALAAAGILEMPGYHYLGDHVEAVLALGDIDRAERIVEDLEARGRVFPRPWTLSVAARCRGLVLASRGDLAGALPSLEAAVAHHVRLESPYELGRTLLAKAHVHRRRTEKRLARDTLTEAVAQLERAGAVTWAARARSELARIRFRAAPTELTETELRIAELAAGGRTNREIASTVFVSPKTVETRLASVYGKLGIRSRAELGAWMAARA